MVVTIRYIIIKPPESGELCQEITEFVVAEDHLSPQGKGDLPPPQTKLLSHNHVGSIINTFTHNIVA